MGRRLEKRVEFDASPEQVWELIATDHGTAAWFVPHRIDPAAGTVEMDFGSGFEVAGRITAWEPGHRFAYAGEEPPENPGFAYEFVVEGREGGGAVLRFVQSGFLDGDDWNDQYDSFDAGWTLFFDNIAQYLRYFAGEPAHPVLTMGYTAGSADEIWPVLLRALGLDRFPDVGDEVTLTPDGPGPISGVVDVAGREFLGVRSAHGLHRIGAEGGDGCGVSAYHYFYGAGPDGTGPDGTGTDGTGIDGTGIDTAAVTAAWQDWLTGHFPTPSPTGAPTS